MLRTARRAALAALLVVAVVACGEDEPVALSGTTVAGDTTTSLAEPEPTELEVTASDFEFEGVPESVPAGVVEVTLRNTGDEDHQAALIRLHDGVTAQQLAAAPTEAEAFTLFEGAGGPHNAAPGASAVSTQALEPGSYLAICFIPSPDGVAHFRKGMVAPFVVEAPAEAVATPELDEADATITMRDFAYELPDDFSGRGTFTIENRGPQQHEMAVYELDDDASIADFQASLAGTASGPPPVTAAGGVTTLAAGRAAAIDLALDPGRYVLMCFLPDVAAGGEPHFLRGMMQEIEVG
jgi:hypothetical protein